MDAAVAGLLGAGIGGIAGIASAMAAPMLTARAEHKKRRSEVYVRAVAVFAAIELEARLLSANPRADVAPLEEEAFFQMSAELALLDLPAVRESYDATSTIGSEWNRQYAEAGQRALASPDREFSQADRQRLDEIARKLREALQGLIRRMRADVR